MVDFIQGSQLRRLLLGNQVIKLAQALPGEPGTANLFTVTGGAVLVTLLAGQVTVAISGTTGSVALGVAPASGLGTAEVAGIATTSVIAAAEVGAWVTPGRAITGMPGALTLNLYGGNAVGVGMPFIVNAGTITVTTSVATITGTLNWYCQYVPLDTGAYVS